MNLMDKIKKVIENHDDDIQVSVSCTQSALVNDLEKFQYNSNNNNGVGSTGSGWT